MSYEGRCSILKWPTLEKRGDYLSLVECYKTVIGNNGLSFNNFFEYTKCKSTRANHRHKLQLKSAKVIVINILSLYAP